MLVDRYWAYKNAWSMDGLPGMERGLETGAKEHVEPIHKMIGPHAPAAPFGPQSYKLTAHLRHQLLKLDRAQVQLTSVLLIALVAFVLGVLVAGYAPVAVATQRGRLDSFLL